MRIYSCHLCGQFATRGEEPDARPICDTHIIAAMVATRGTEEPLARDQFMDLEKAQDHDVSMLEIEAIAAKRYAAVVSECWAEMQPEASEMAA